MDAGTEGGYIMKKAYRWITGLILLSFVTVGVFLTMAPDVIPAHYDFAGNIDRWGSKYEFLLFPAVTALMGGFLAFVARFEGKKGREMNEKVVTILGIWVLLLFNAIWLFFMWKAVQGTVLSNGWDLGSKGLLVLMMASFIPLGNIMPKTQRNAVFGLRTKWSMANDVCWQKSQRFGGYLMVATGLVGIAVVSILPVLWAGYASLVLILAMTVVATIGTYRIWIKESVEER